MSSNHPSEKNLQQELQLRHQAKLRKVKANPSKSANHLVTRFQGSATQIDMNLHLKRLQSFKK